VSRSSEEEILVANKNEEISHTPPILESGPSLASWRSSPFLFTVSITYTRSAKIQFSVRKKELTKESDKNLETWQ
jgi:hypothetical protein